MLFPARPVTLGPTFPYVGVPSRTRRPDQPLPRVRADFVRAPGRRRNNHYIGVEWQLVELNGKFYLAPPRTAQVVEIDAITGSFKPGTAYTAVAPCNANSAPTGCPAPPRYPLNSLGTINLKTGAVGQVALNGVVAPKGLIFVDRT
jgi:hypothetical protein